MGLASTVFFVVFGACPARPDETARRGAVRLEMKGGGGGCGVVDPRAGRESEAFRSESRALSEGRLLIRLMLFALD